MKDVGVTLEMASLRLFHRGKCSEVPSTGPLCFIPLNPSTYTYVKWLRDPFFKALLFCDNLKIMNSCRIFAFLRRTLPIRVTLNSRAQDFTILYVLSGMHHSSAEKPTIYSKIAITYDNEL